ncbi:hypothetical protein BG015_010085 [Linnemannia schmuckeri]|uniref:Uncharacterized protein n=1 Tax=Linnemannia schmuckeri TaxID=64567 RepID=A0A9P5RV06_9FUNG|nr:hypothetical protein BG015_010085 [Linnemannia schmuckeri]
MRLITIELGACALFVVSMVQAQQATATAVPEAGEEVISAEALKKKVVYPSLSELESRKKAKAVKKGESGQDDKKKKAASGHHHHKAAQEHSEQHKQRQQKGHKQQHVHHHATKLYHSRRYQGAAKLDHFHHHHHKLNVTAAAKRKHPHAKQHHHHMKAQNNNRSTKTKNHHHHRHHNGCIMYETITVVPVCNPIPKLDAFPDLVSIPNVGADTSQFPNPAGRLPIMGGLIPSIESDYPGEVDNLSGIFLKHTGLESITNPDEFAPGSIIDENDGKSPALGYGAVPDTPVAQPAAALIAEPVLVAPPCPTPQSPSSLSNDDNVSGGIHPSASPKTNPEPKIDEDKDVIDDNDVDLGPEISVVPADTVNNDDEDDEDDSSDQNAIPEASSQQQQQPAQSAIVQTPASVPVTASTPTPVAVAPVAVPPMLTPQSPAAPAAEAPSSLDDTNVEPETDGIDNDNEADIEDDDEDVIDSSAPAVELDEDDFEEAIDASPVDNKVAPAGAQGESAQTIAEEAEEYLDDAEEDGDGDYEDEDYDDKAGVAVGGLPEQILQSLRHG